MLTLLDVQKNHKKKHVLFHFEQEKIAVKSD